MAKNHPGTFVPAGLLLVAAVGIAAAFPLGALAVREASPASVSSVRYLTAVLCIGATLAPFTRRQSRGLLPRSARPAIGAMGLTVALFNLCFLGALQLLSPSTGALIIAGAMPVTAWATAHLWLGEEIRIRHLFGMGAAIAGILVVFVASGGGAEGARNAFAGGVLYVLGGVIWGANSVISQVAMRHVDPLTATFWSVLLGLAVLLPLALIADGPGFLGRMGPSLGFSAMLGLVSTAIPLLCLLGAIRAIGAARAAATSYLVPIFAVVLDFLLLGQGLSWMEVVGGTLTIAGFVLITSARRVAPPVPIVQ